MRRRRRAAVDGFLNVLKPAGVTSHHCVAVMRRVLRTTEIGHAGTLDPMATGVLVMGVGRATKFLPHLVSDKAYRGVIRFGVTTDTDDITGAVLSERLAPWLTRDTAQHHLTRFVGAIDQTPPKVSALKVDGTRSYELARSNVDFKVKARRVHIHRIDLLDFVSGDFPEAKIFVDCGAGTYIRSIARECGEAIEIPPPLSDTCGSPLLNHHGRPYVGGTLTQLERTRSGSFTLDTSRSFDDIKAAHEAGDNILASIESAVSHLPVVALNDGDVSRWLKNGEVRLRDGDVHESLGEETVVPLLPNMSVAVYDTSGIFLGVSTAEEIDARYVLRGRTFASLDR